MASRKSKKEQGEDEGEGETVEEPVEDLPELPPEPETDPPLEAPQLRAPARAREEPEFGPGTVSAPVPTELRRLQRALQDAKWDPKMKESLWKEWVELPMHMQMNPQLLHNAMIARGSSPYLANHVVSMVFRPEMSMGPSPSYGAYGGYVYSVPPAAAPSVQEEDPVVRRKRDLDEMRLRSQELLEERRYAALIRQMEQEGGGGGGGLDPGSMVELIRTGMELKQTGAGPEAIMEALKTGLEIAKQRPENGTNQLMQELTKLREEMLTRQLDTVQKMHEREIELVRASQGGDALGGIGQVAEAMKKMREAGIPVGAPDANVQLKIEELQARRELARMGAETERQQKTEEATWRRQKELVELQTQERVLQLGDRAIQVIADPISKAVAESMKARAAMPPGQSPPVAQSGQQLTKEQQIAALDDLVAKANAAKQQLLTQGQITPS